MEPIVTFLGLQMPTLIPIFVFAGVVQMVVDKILSDFGLYKYIWHPGLFRTALFLCIFAIPSILIYQ